MTDAITLDRDEVTATRVVTGAALRFMAGARQVGCTISNEDQGEDGVVLMSAGMDFSNFRDNKPVVLYSHDPQRPVARAVEITRAGREIRAVAQFPEVGISADSDLVYGLVKAGIINAVSVGFVPLESEPLRNGSLNGRRITRSRLLEFSFVAIPALPSELVTMRTAEAADEAIRRVRAFERREQFRRRDAAIERREQLRRRAMAEARRAALQ